MDQMALNPETSYLFEQGLRISLQKRDCFIRGSERKMHNIICVTNVSNYICSVLDGIIKQEDPYYVPKPALVAPIAAILFEEKYIRRKKEGQLRRKKSSLSDGAIRDRAVFFCNVAI